MSSIKRKLNLAFILLIIITILLWGIKIIDNKNKNTYYKETYPQGGTIHLDGIEIIIKDAELLTVQDFLSKFGKRYSDSYNSEYLKSMNGTKVLVCKLEINNKNDMDYPLDSLFGLYVRMEHKWISAFDPFITQSINPIFSRKEAAGIVKSGEKENVIMITDINHISLTDSTWNNLSNYDYFLCYGGHDKEYFAYELLFKIKEN